MTVTIYHNPRCTKSRNTLELLIQQNINPKQILYLDQPPQFETLKSILDLLGLTARQLMRQHEPPYAQNQLDNPELTEESLINAMIQHPILIERPIVLANGKAAIGRPPENILEIL